MTKQAKWAKTDEVFEDGFGELVVRSVLMLETPNGVWTIRKVGKKYTTTFENYDTGRREIKPLVDTIKRAKSFADGRAFYYPKQGQ